MERYESLGLVGEGSYGTVLKCRHRDSGRLVAIKKFMDSDDDKTVKKIALREIKLLRQLHHDNLVNLLEVWKRRRRWYLVFEFVERTLLDDLEQNPNGLDLSTSRQYLYQILRAVAFCHQQNIIHRDIKPENILISQGGVVKLCDFGFARTMTSPAEGGVYTDYVATRWYRAPELLVGDTKYGKPVDVWAVGCLLIEMLTGQPLFPGDSDLDQIYHIVRCFGNLTAHHQELFYRNPVFSGVRLPECSGRVSLEQRFPSITPTTLDLAQSCLQMDPEKRAQCSELLEHPLFTKDSFHMRILDELNAKIQKDHRENSTFPKIAKTPRREKDEGDEKNRRGKDRKRSEDVDEKVNKEKEKRDKEGGEEKTMKIKVKQTSKPLKTIRNTSEPLITTKQSKMLGAKIISNAAKTTVSMRSKPGKATGAPRMEPDISKPAKTLTSEKGASPEPREGHFKHTDVKGRASSGLHSSCLDNIVSSVTDKYVIGVLGSSKSQPSTHYREGWNNSNTKVSKLSKSSTTDHPNRSSSQKAKTEYHEGASVTSKISNSDQIQTLRSTTSVHQTDYSSMDTEKRGTTGCQVLLSNPKPTKTTSNSGPKMTYNNTTTSPSKTLTSALSMHVFKEANPTHSTATLPKGTSNSKLSKSPSSSDTKPNDTRPNKPLTGLPTDRELSEASIATKNQQDSWNSSNKDIKNTKISDALDGDCKENPESSEQSSIHRQSTSPPKITTESRTVTSVSSLSKEILKTNTLVGNTVLKTLKVSDKENREDLALSVSISATTKSSVNQTSKVSRNANIEQKNNSSEAKPNIKPLKPPRSKSLIGEPKTELGSFGKSTTTMILKTQKTTFSTEEKKKEDADPNRNDATNLSTEDLTNFTSKDPKTLTRSSIFHNMGIPDINEFDLREPHSSPPPPPPPSSTPLFLPPSSTSLIPSFFVFSTNSPAISDHLTLGVGFHPGTHSLLCTDKMGHHGAISNRLAQRSLSSHITGSATAQVSEKSQICDHSFLSDHCNLGNSGSNPVTKKKPDIHFPDLRSPVLPELRGREGKHNKSTSKDQRKDKQTVPSIPPSDPQQQGPKSTDAQKP